MQMESSCLQLRHMENCQQSGLVKTEDTVGIRAVYPSLGIQLLKKKKKQIQIYLVLTDKSQARQCLLQVTQVPGTEQPQTPGCTLTVCASIQSN